MYLQACCLLFPTHTQQMNRAHNTKVAGKQMRQHELCLQNTMLSMSSRAHSLTRTRLKDCLTAEKMELRYEHRRIHKLRSRSVIITHFDFLRFNSFVFYVSHRLNQNHSQRLVFAAFSSFRVVAVFIVVLPIVCALLLASPLYGCEINDRLSV